MSSQKIWWNTSRLAQISSSSDCILQKINLRLVGKYRKFLYPDVVGHIIRLMIFKTIKWLIVFCAIAVVGLLAWPTIKRIREDNIKFGKNFNHVRDSLGIPIIEENWMISESNPYDRFWKIADSFGKTNLPIHESKISYFQDKGSLLGEEDDFFYDMSDSLAYRLILRYEFKKSVWNNEFVRIRKFKKGPAEYWPVTISQTDSVLAKWGLSR